MLTFPIITKLRKSYPYDSDMSSREQLVQRYCEQYGTPNRLATNPFSLMWTRNLILNRPFIPITTDWLPIYYDCQPGMDVEPWFGSVMGKTSENIPPSLNSYSAQDLFFGRSTAFIRMLATADFPTFRFQVIQYFSHKSNIADRGNLLFEYPDSVIELQRVTNMIENWMSLETYPLVNVVVSSTGRVSLHQKGFYRKNDSQFQKTSSANHSRTLLPIMYFELEEKRVKTIWFEEDGSSIILQQVLKPFKLNWHQTGYYRVNYSKDLWTDFVKTIKHEKMLDPEDKANLIDDSFTLAEYGHIHHGIPFSLVIYLREGFEMHPLPWLTAAKHLQKVSRRTQDSEMAYLLEVFVKLIVESYVDDENIWSIVNQSVMDVIRKVTIINFAASFHYAEVIDRLKYILNVFIEEGTIPLELKRVTFAYALQDEEVDEDMYNNVLECYNEEINVLKKYMYWTALVGVRSQLHIDNLWDMTNNVDETSAEIQFDRLVMMKILSTNPLSHGVLWPEILRNWTTYSSLPEQDKDNIKTILFNIIEYTNNEDLLQEISDFGASNDDLDVQMYALKMKDDVARWEPSNYRLFVEEWLHLYIMNST